MTNTSAEVSSGGKKLKSIGGVGAGRIVGNLAEFVAVALAARMLGPADFGKFSYILAVALTSGQLFDLGTARILTIRTSLLIGANAKSENVGHIYGSLIWLRLALGAVFLPILIWTGFTAHWKYLAAGVVLGFFVSVVLSLSAVFQSQLEFGKFASSVYLPSSLRLAAILLLTVSGHGTLYNLISLYLAAHVITVLVLLCLLPRNIIHLSTPLRAARNLLSLFHFGKWLMAAAVFEVVYLKTDVFALRLLGTPHELGIYSATFVFAGIFNLIFSSVVAYYVPVMCRAVGEGKMSLLREYFLQGTDLLALIGIPAAMGIWAVAPTLFPLIFGEQYRESAAVWPILVVYCVCMVVNQTGAVFFALEKLHIITILTFGIVVSNLLFCSLLVPRFGAYGAAWGIGIGQMLNLTFSWIATYRLIGTIPNFSRMAYYLACSLILFPIVRAVSFPIPRLELGIKIVVGVFVYGGLLFLSRKNIAPIVRVDPEYGD